jgi:putative membrane protein
MSELEKRSILRWLGVSYFVTLFGLVLLFGRSVASPAPPVPQAASTSSAAATPDHHFASAAAAGGAAEVKFGKLAEEKASDPAVKAFGKRMVDDHSKAGEQLKEVAQSENMSLPSNMKAQDRAQYERLSKLSGAEFDRAYMQMMVKDHEEDVAEFKKEAASGKNAALKNFAAQTLPTLEEHLKQARDLAANRKASM